MKMLRSSAVSRSSIAAVFLAVAWGMSCGSARGRASPGDTAAASSVFGRGLSSVAATKSIRQKERAMFERLNRDRTQRGLEALLADERLTQVARHHSADMRDNSFFEHESAQTGSAEDRLDAGGYLFVVVRENLAEGRNVNGSQDQLLASSHHFDNIVATDVSHLGIGIVAGGVVDADNLTITQLFATPRHVQSPRAALASLRKRLRAERSILGRARMDYERTLMDLARQQIQELEDNPTAKALERVSQAVVAELNRKVKGGVQVMALTVSGPDQVRFPPSFVQCSDCGLGMATRRVQSERGRPLLQVLLIFINR